MGGLIEFKRRGYAYLLKFEILSQSQVAEGNVHKIVGRKGLF